MSWPAALLALLICHAVGDVMFQTDWQAVTKTAGLGDRAGRRALVSHVLTYTLAFVPALIWIAHARSPGRALLVAAVVSGPHLVVDDGRVVRLWLHDVKRAARSSPALTIAVDQTLHLLCLLGAALVASA